MPSTDQTAALSRAMFSSAKGDWCTPTALFARLSSIWSFTLDAAASDHNHTCEKYFTEERSAFENSWSGHRVWINPPYGRQVGAWVEAANSYHESGDCPVIVMLIPARTETVWWHTAIEGGARAHFIRGRLRFQGAESSAPFPSALLIWENLP